MLAGLTFAVSSPAFPHDLERTQVELTARAAVLQQQHNFVYPLQAFLAERRTLTRSRGKVLTDDFAPVESLLAIEKHNRKLEEFSEPVAK